MNDSKEVVLGQQYQDPVSGWQGTATSFHSYVYGCRRVTVSGVDKDGKPDEYTFDEPQLVWIGQGHFADTAPLEQTGGPRGTTHGGV